MILADQGDNAPGGGPADGTWILNELRNANWPDAALIIRDPQAANESSQAGIGKHVSLTVGGKSDNLHGSSVEFKGTVRMLSDGTYTEPRQKTSTKMGTTAVIRSGQTDLIVTGYNVIQAEPAPFLSAGVDPSRKEIVAVKSAHAFRHNYEKFAKLILDVDTPGIQSQCIEVHIPKSSRRSTRSPQHRWKTDSQDSSLPWSFFHKLHRSRSGRQAPCR